MGPDSHGSVVNGQRAYAVGSMLRDDGVEIIEGSAFGDGVPDLLKRLLERLQSRQPHSPLMGFALPVGSAG